MNKYIIFWDAGYGKSYEVVEAKNEEEASGFAYDRWLEEASANADYGVDEYTKELAIERCVEDEDEENAQ